MRRRTVLTGAFVLWVAAFNVVHSGLFHPAHHTRSAPVTRPVVRPAAAVRPAPPPDPDARLTAADGHLVRNGKPVFVAGINAYEAATWWGTNWGCGSTVYDLKTMFDQVPVGGVVRFWAFQAQGWNNKSTPGRIDFTGIDRVVQTAQAERRQVIMTLSDQAGVCDDGHWHDQAWYDGGYASARADDDGRGLGNLSYLDWVKKVVARYAASPAVAAWEPVNEPEASDCTGVTGSGCENPAVRHCPAGASVSLASFFTKIGSVIRSIDPRHLISEGVSGGGQCGLDGDGFLTVGASPGIDLLTYHDYGDDSALPSGLYDRLTQAQQLHKPLIVEEAGVSAGTGCGTLAQRSDEVWRKAEVSLLYGSSGWMPWWYEPAGPGACNTSYGSGDPAMSALGAAAAAADGQPTP